VRGSHRKRPQSYHTQAKVATTPTDEEPPFNLENLQEVIAEIRPFLNEHGGNVKVDHVDEENRNVDVTLEGQCATCPLATRLQPCKEVLRAGLQPRKNRVVDSAKS
jgi:Fe-S cluster biogenesis protein NfuA